ncbi:MAG: MerR family transcriptional regulator [Myxococcales bacterium]|nr:MerR family transcriptional regulator [Myxococcales bacterium]
MSSTGDGYGEAGDIEWLTTGDMARLGHTTLRTVRFYEAQGLIVARDRAEGSHRKFHKTEFSKLQIIMDLRDAGLSVQEIRELIETKERCEDVVAASEELAAGVGAQLAELDRRITALHRVRRELLKLMDMLEVCRKCGVTDYPEHCGDCNVVQRCGADRATALLWKN